MTLLDKVIVGATGDSLSTGALLRQMLMLGSRLRSQELITWASDELNGYEKRAQSEYPRYRGPLSVAVIADGITDADYGPVKRKQWRIDERDVPSKNRNMLTVYLHHPLAELEKWAARHQPVNIAWSNAKVGRYNMMCRQGDANGPDGFKAESVYMSVPASMVHGIVDTIRTRALMFALELQQEFPDAGEIDGPTTQTERVRESVTNNFNTNIYGGTNTVANGENFTQNVQVRQGDADGLLDFFKNQGLDQDGQAELQAAIEEERDAPGKGVRKFLEKLGNGTYKVGADVATPTAIALGKAALSGFFGVPIG